MADNTKINLGAGTAQTAGTTPQAAGQVTQDDKFHIPDVVMQKYPDLVKLIKETDSMTDAERTYWFQIMPIMTQQQVDKLRGILLKEKEQLAKLDTEYEKELQRINEKHLLEWKEFQTKKSRDERKAAEAQADKEESKQEEEILKKLNEV